MDDQVLVDTCIWAAVFSRPNSTENRIVEQLIEQDRVVVIGPVLAEVLYGFRRRGQADWAASRLRNLGWREAEWDDWARSRGVGSPVGSKRAPTSTNGSRHRRDRSSAWPDGLYLRSSL